MTTPGATLLVQLLPVVRQHLPPGITPAYLDGFVQRNKSTLVAVLDRALAARAQGIGISMAMSRVCLECRASSRSTRRGCATP